MPVVLKMKYQDEVRRVLLDLDEVTYSDVCSGVQSAFAHLESSSISMKYIDDEGDLCTLCSSTLEDLVANAVEISGRKILKLELFQAKERSSSAVKTSLPTADGAYTAGATAVGGAATAAAAAAAAGKQSESTETCWAKQSPSQADHWKDWGTEMHQKWAAAAADWHKKWADPGKGWAQESQGQAADHWNSYVKHWMNAAKHWNDHQATCWSGLAKQMAAGAPDHGMSTSWADHSQDQAAYWSHDHCGAKWKKEEDWILKPKKMLWLLCRLRANGSLSTEILASMFVSLLSPLIAKVADHQENLHWKLLLKWKKTEMLPILESLSELASRTPGLEHCSEALMAVSHEHPSAGEALLMLLTAVDTLPFLGRIAFAQSFFKAQEERLHQYLDAQDDWMPCWSKKVSLDHWGITCDGCNMHPIKGPRFKCLTRENYDLCGECFAKKTAILNEEDEFQIIVTDSGMWKQKFFYGKGMDWKGHGKGKKKGHGKGKWFCGKGWWADDHDHAEEQEQAAAFAGSADWKAEEDEQVAAEDAWGAFYGKGMDCKAKGKGKKKGHGKGKWFWRKGWWADDYDHAEEQEQAAAFAGSAPLKADEEEQVVETVREEAATTTSQTIRPCASGGCSFQATWHEKFCCNACKDSSASHHGPRCERKPVSQEDAA